LQIQSGKGYDLNVSMFERLVMEGIQFQALGRQHRMQPAISRVVRDLTYPHLEDAEHVNNREPLLGVGSEAHGLKNDSLFFVTHAWAESADADAGVSAMDSASRVNLMESLMVVKVLKYILQQGYSMQEVVVLTPYLGQLRTLMRHMREQGISEMADKRDVEEMEKQGMQVEVGCGF
jgi:superfamily I DNA and/or RNA helicase